jgi:hypothetical protein
LRMTRQCPALHVKWGYFSPSPCPSSASPSFPLRFPVPLPFLSRPSVFFRLEQMWGVMSVKGSSHCFRLPSWKPGGGRARCVLGTRTRTASTRWGASIGR